MWDSISKFFQKQCKKGESIEAVMERYSGNKALYKSQKKKKKKNARWGKNLGNFQKYIFERILL